MAGIDPGTWEFPGARGAGGLGGFGTGDGRGRSGDQGVVVLGVGAVLGAVRAPETESQRGRLGMIADRILWAALGSFNGRDGSVARGDMG